jgi:putative oxidoreductase
MKVNFQPNTSIPAFIARLFISIVLFPHGAQKMFGWWNGPGWSGTMQFFKDIVGLPFVIGILVIVTEFFGPLFLLAGVATRFWATAILIVMIGVVVTVQNQYFFMNWFNNQDGEGMEFFLLMIGLCIIVIYTGGGVASLDNKLGRRTQ